MPTKDELKMLQSLPLEVKVLKTQQRIREWVTHFGVEGVYVAFSGGKDSTVLLHLVRELYPDVQAVFVNTGLEFPEIQQFVKTFDNVKVLYPSKTFKQIIMEYGYPVLSKIISHNVSIARRNPNGKVMKNMFNPEKRGQNAMHKWSDLLTADFWISEKCCDFNKEAPAAAYRKETGKKQIVATMACESKNREDSWLKTGCNAFNCGEAISKPMSFWTEQDVLTYIYENDIKIAEPYGNIVTEYNQIPFAGCACTLCTTGCRRTGCIYCGFGAHLEKGEGRFERLKRTHPKQYEFCINGGAYDTDGIWKPNEQGLGMGHVFDVLNSLYGDDFIKYK